MTAEQISTNPTDKTTTVLRFGLDMTVQPKRPRCSATLRGPAACKTRLDCIFCVPPDLGVGCWEAPLAEMPEKVIMLEVDIVVSRIDPCNQRPKRMPVGTAELRLVVPQYGELGRSSVFA